MEGVELHVEAWQLVDITNPAKSARMTLTKTPCGLPRRNAPMRPNMKLSWLKVASVFLTLGSSDLDPSVEHGLIQHNSLFESMESLKRRSLQLATTNPAPVRTWRKYLLSRPVGGLGIAPVRTA